MRANLASRPRLIPHEGLFIYFRAAFPTGRILVDQGPGSSSQRSHESEKHQQGLSEISRGVERVLCCLQRSSRRHDLAKHSLELSTSSSREKHALPGFRGGWTNLPSAA